jgi:cell division protein FtsA
MGAVVVDIGAGTTSMAVYIDGDVWHTHVLGIGGSMITSDIAHGLRLPISQAEEIKLQHGFALMEEVSEDDKFTIRAFGEDQPIQVSRRELAEIIEARVEEIFSLLIQEIKRSGYDGLLPAGMVLTGGTAQLPGIRNLASSIMNLPVRVARPENLLGLTDQLLAPPYSTSVGLLYWALMMSESSLSPQKRGALRNREVIRWDTIKDFLKRLLP